MDATERKIIVFTSFGHYFTHFYMLVFPVLLLPMTRSLGIPLETVLPKGFLMYLLYGLLAMPWGFLSDHFNPRIVMGSGMLVAGAGFLISGLIRNPVFLSFSLALVGIGCAAYHPSGLSLLSKGLRSRGRALGLNGIFGNLGIASAPFAAGILNYLFGWQATLLMLGAAGLAIGVVCLVVPFSVDRDTDRQQSSAIEKRHVTKLFLNLCAIVTVFGLMYRAFTLVLPTFMETRLYDTFESLMASDGSRAGFFPADQGSLFAAIVTGCAYLLGMLGQAVGGRIADRFELKRAYLVYVSFALPFVILLRYASGLWLVVFAGFFAFFTLGLQPIENSLFAMLTPARWRSLAYGVKFTLVFGIGSLSVFLVTRVQTRFDLNAVIVLLLGYLLLILAGMTVLNLLGRKQDMRHTHDS
jgi:MFS family permease